MMRLGVRGRFGELRSEVNSVLAKIGVHQIL